MHIALITTSYPDSPGDPSGHFVETEARAWVDLGHTVTVLCPGRARTAQADPPRVLRLGGASLFGWPGALERLRRRPWSAGAAAVFVARARYELRRRGPFDRIVAHWVLPCAWPIAAGVEAPLEVVAHGSDVRLLLEMPAHLRLAILRSLLRQGAAFRFVSEHLLRALADELSEIEPRSRVQPCGIVISGVPGRDHARQSLGIGAHAFLAVIVARLVASKRVDVALNALSLLPECRVTVVGDGPERAGLERHHPNVRFLGHLRRDRALTWIAAADLLLSTSRQEGSPTVVREARALGVPVVATRAGDLEAWSRNDSGIVVVGNSC